MPTDHFAARRVLARLHRFQDLVRHHQRWAHQIELARPLRELLPGMSESDPNRPQLLEREIDRLIPLVHIDLNRAGLSTIVYRTEPDVYHDKERDRIVRGKMEVDRWDLIGNYFEHAFGEGPSAATFNLLIRTLDRGIGLYEAARRAAFRDLLNPLSWIAWLVGLPLRVLERAGLAEKSSTSVAWRIYVWGVRLLTVAFILLLMAWLGVAIPWDRVLAFAFRIGS